ncbi:Isoquinoline 1-oxidoreductase [Allomuricauda ruestringensis DSM 13258]|uniref:Isoquinoline 1-oxidoreductase n=1 Tax=Allomuricauda ruestringensis (strain DSM 13258 / CIP 107369 / LMG 19739 / B1) TaxID=886377 RepID=G2PJ78_ALLRU|nr:(2Fe-2S)-binding protein [Allomuricauda ruestringensis]AEM71899.1 Isoquinoline 1-oxidoreductase [Allomuricauda ruestringensis DSM 13258]
MATYTINLNGEDQSFTCDENMPLLWVLREVLQKTGTKYGCGIGQCGACTIHLDGNAVRSCMMPISAVGEAKITTIEGIGDPELHPVQQAWKELQVPQCGYCQSGQIMSAVHLLQQNPDPSDDEITEVMSGNICRCGTYDRIKKAVRLATKLLENNQLP